MSDKSIKEIIEKAYNKSQVVGSSSVYISTGEEQEKLIRQLKETQEKLKIAVSALENLIDNTEYGVKQWQAAWSPNKETKAQTSIRAARQALEKIGERNE